MYDLIKEQINANGPRAVLKNLSSSLSVVATNVQSENC
jgi:hypothetical protein